MRIILSGHGKSAGVYRITNVVNGRVYIGSTKRFDARARDHASGLRSGRHFNAFLQRDYNKCGACSFVFEVVHVIADQTERLSVEEALIGQAFGASCYNATTVCPPVVKAFLTAEVRAKMSAARKGKKHSTETKAKIAAAGVGRKMSPEAVAKSASARKGQVRGPHTDEWKAKVSASLKAAPMTPKRMNGQRACAKARTGAINTPEHRARISASKKGKPWTQARRDAQAKRIINKETPCLGSA